MSLLLLNLLQLALDRVAAITLGLSKVLCLLAGLGIGVQNAIMTVLVNVDSLAAVAAPPITVVTLWAVFRVASEDRDSSGGGWHLCFDAGSVLRPANLLQKISQTNQVI